MSLPKHYIKRYKQQKMNFEKLLGYQVFKKLQQQSVLIFFKFCTSVPSFALICCVIYTFFQGFDRLFYCFTQFGDSSRSLNFDKLLDTAPLKRGETGVPGEEPLGARTREPTTNSNHIRRQTPLGLAGAPCTE